MTSCCPGICRNDCVCKSAFIPKGFCHIAQGCERSELRCEKVQPPDVPQRATPLRIFPASICIVSRKTGAWVATSWSKISLKPRSFLRKIPQIAQLSAQFKILNGVAQRGSVIGDSPRPQPFQGRCARFICPQGSPHTRATLGYVAQVLRSKDSSLQNQTSNY